MRVGSLQAPILQDVCIFCATRIQLSTSRSFSQRRLFRSGNAPNKPPEAAAATRQEDSSSDPVPHQLSNGKKWSQTAEPWAGYRPTWQGTPRYTPPPQPELEALKKEQEAPQKAKEKIPSPQIVVPQAQTSSHFQSPARRSTLDRYIGAARRDQPKGISLWKCECGFQNPQNDRTCRNCRAPGQVKTRYSDDSNIARDWQHVRVGERSIKLDLGPMKEDVRSNEPVVDKELEEARQKRMEQSKQRSFVGLDQFRRPTLDFRDVPRHSRQVPDLQGGQEPRGGQASNRRVPNSNERPGSIDATSPGTGISGYKRWVPPQPPSIVETPSDLPRSAAPSSQERAEGGRKGSAVGRFEDQYYPELQTISAHDEKTRSYQGYRPTNPASALKFDGPQSLQPKVTLDKDMGSSTPKNRSGQDREASPWQKRPDTTAWKAWTPAQSKADLDDILSNEAQSSSRPRRRQDRDSRHDEHHVYKDVHTNETLFDEAPQYGPTEDMKEPEPQVTESRMARRLQELQEESEPKRPTPARFDSTRERRNNIAKTRKHIEELEDSRDDEDDGARIRRERKKQRKNQQQTRKLQGPPTPIYLPEFISVANLAGALRIKIEDFTSKMESLGFEETNNDHVLDAETAGLIAAEFNFEPIVDQEEDQDLMPRPPAEDKSILPARPPVVTIMGHVDHGKTTLLDWLRKSSVAATEYGGITQHIGAFSVPMPSGRIITFLDTPGHAAFLDMRQRGANVTDIVILVVAADDSVKPQTVEAIKHAQAAKVPMIVAVNKIDKEDANVDKVKQDLARYGVEIEDYGGDTQVVSVSGKTGQGIETLEESALALADILDMRAETDGQAEGWVLEATTKKAGRVATVLVRRGTVYPGDIIVAGTTWARVRTLRNEAGAAIPSAGPGTPVEIDGWKEQPAAGDEVLQADDEQHARSVIDYRLEVAERTKMASDMSAVNESRRLEQERREVAEQAAENATKEGVHLPPSPATPYQDNSKAAPLGLKEVPLIIKADVSGSLEAILSSILALGNNSVRASILRSGVGAVSEFDVQHATSAEGHIVTFNLSTPPNIRRMMESTGVKLIEQNIIYRLVDQVKGLLEEYLEPERTKRVLGDAEVAQVFEINTKGRTMVPVAGCRIRNGVVERNKRVLVKRGADVVFDGPLSSLKNRKQNATEMRKGTECGMGFEGWTDFKVGDQIQSYEEIVERRTL